jgi:hypothetical protein
MQTPRGWRRVMERVMGKGGGRQRQREGGRPPGVGERGGRGGGEGCIRRSLGFVKVLGWMLVGRPLPGLSQGILLRRVQSGIGPWLQFGILLQSFVTVLWSIFYLPSVGSLA